VTAFEVLQFSSANLFKALSSARCTQQEVGEQERPKYLYGYLAAIKAKTIVVENDYVDGDYLEDFASYYVRCFERYERFCKRLHFFTAEDLDEAALKALVMGQAPPERTASIIASYLGFIVARPLPSAIVGRTLLQTYPPDNGRRNYPVIRDYQAHLFGTALTVRSLPFQEQDAVLAACATVALWCAFHKTAEKFGTPSPRPAAITRAANRATHRGRSVPTHGLIIEEMCQAVSEVGLEPELVEVMDRDVPLVSLAYAHLKAGLPVILIAEVESRGLHAITLTGYSLKNTRVHTQEVAGGGSSIPMIGLRIDEFYGHDDQIGPFSRILIGPSASTYPVLLKGSWVDKSTGKQLELRPEAVLIPVYNKIRVTFLDVLGWLTPLTGVLNLVVPDPATSLEWDVHLTTTTEYKEALKSASLPAPEIERLLFKPQPRFLWRAVLRVLGVEVLELLTDATDMARSFPIREALWLNDSFKQGVKALITSSAMQQSLNDTLSRRFLDFLKDSVR
jgi:hypothetical protein